MNKTPILLSLLSMLCLAGCTGADSSENSSENNYDVDPINEITTDEGEENDYDKDYEEQPEVETPEGYDSFSGNEITSAGNFYLKGNYDNLVVSAANAEVYLFLDGVTINCSTGKAIDGAEKTTNIHIVLLNGSVNTLNNDFSDTNSVHIKGNAYISGTGTLNISSAQKNGLKAGKDLFVSGEGVKLVVSGANHAISARSVTVSKATVEVSTSGKDGIQTECDSDVVEYTKKQGFAYFVDAKVTADVKGDGVQAETFVYISGGEFNIKTEGDFIAYSAANMSTYSLSRDDFKYVKSGSLYKRVATDEIRTLNSNYYALINSVKGIKAGVIENDTNGDKVEDEITTGDYEVSIAHLAKVTINSTDDCIHTNYGKVTIDSSNLVLNTLDDGAHADYNLSVNNASIQVSGSYEGLEGANVTIDGEATNIVINSEDDGINAASDLVSSTYIYIKNGYLRVYASGDGVDANTGLYFQGGTTIVEGPGRNNGSVDSDNIYFQGGIVFACSTNGMKERMSATQNTFVYQGTTMSAKKLIKIVGSDDQPLFSYTLKQSCNQLIFSHESLNIGSSYKIMADSSTVATISMTSSLTQVGSSGGGMPR